MPIEYDEDESGKIFSIHARGRLVKEDYKPFTFEFERLLKRNGRLRVLFDMTGFQGFDLGAAWADIKFEVKHFADIDRLAIVGDKQWQHGMAVFFKPFSQAEIRYFEHADCTEAKKWLEEIPKASGPGREP